jgi:hypothetical protein
MFINFVSVLMCVAAVAAANPKWHELNGYTFEKYVSDFNFKFPANELATRKAAFATELARVQAHNAKNLSWKEGMNKFSVLTSAERKAYRGRSKGAAHQQKNMLKNAHEAPANFRAKPVSELPANVDWRTKGKYIFFYLFLSYTYVIFSPLLSLGDIPTELKVSCLP